MSYGIEIYDDSGSVIFDSKKLKHRLWWSGEVNSTGNYYYDEPLDHKPTLVCYAADGNYPYIWKHITNSSGEYTGFEALTGSSGNKLDEFFPVDNTLFFVFAKM